MNLLKNSFFQHLKEEEMFWQNVFKKHEEKIMDEFVDKIIKGEHMKDVRLFFVSVFGEIGYEDSYFLSKPLPCALKIEPWASQKWADDYVKKLTFIPKNFVFPSW
jgi:hypothetical protein